MFFAFIIGKYAEKQHLFGCKEIYIVTGNNKLADCGYAAVSGYLDISFTGTDGSNNTVGIYYNYRICKSFIDLFPIGLKYWRVDEARRDYY